MATWEHERCGQNSDLALFWGPSRIIGVYAHGTSTSVWWPVHVQECEGVQGLGMTNKVFTNF